MAINASALSECASLARASMAGKINDWKKGIGLPSSSDGRTVGEWLDSLAVDSRICTIPEIADGMFLAPMYLDFFLPRLRFILHDQPPLDRPIKGAKWALKWAAHAFSTFRTLCRLTPPLWDRYPSPYETELFDLYAAQVLCEHTKLGTVLDVSRGARILSDILRGTELAETGCGVFWALSSPVLLEALRDSAHSWLTSVCRLELHMYLNDARIDERFLLSETPLASLADTFAGRNDTEARNVGGRCGSDNVECGENDGCTCSQCDSCRRHPFFSSLKSFKDSAWMPNVEFPLPKGPGKVDEPYGDLTGSAFISSGQAV